jgi:hypothetical protein
MNVSIARGSAAAGVAVFFTGAAVLGMQAARADDITSHWTPDGRQAVFLSDIDGLIDQLPVCAEEDCSDQPGQSGMWLDRDTGDWYLELGEAVTLLVYDDTVTWDHGTAAADGAVPGEGN